MMVLRFIISGWLSLLLVPVLPVNGRGPETTALAVGSFSDASPGEAMPTDWEALIFPHIERLTQYRLVQEGDGVFVQAQSSTSASGMIRNQRFDAMQYPWLAWRWKIEHVLEKGDWRTKQGDDYAARIYVVFEFDAQKANWWQRMAYAVASRSAGRELPGTMLIYIWANQAPKGAVVDNPYTDKAKMVVLQSGNAKAGQWIAESRNLYDDYVRAFGREPPLAMGIAIMTDTDDTGETTSALYGDILLSQDE